MWRWSYQELAQIIMDIIFSTYVEVILGNTCSGCRSPYFLHVCGGDPGRPQDQINKIKFSPRMWRWSLNSAFVVHGSCGFSPRMWRWSRLLWMVVYTQTIFSTYVEVILIFIRLQILHEHFLHVCGGDPLTSWLKSISFKFSPRMWRWSSLLR